MKNRMTAATASWQTEQIVKKKGKNLQICINIPITNPQPTKAGPSLKKVLIWQTDFFGCRAPLLLLLWPRVFLFLSSFWEVEGQVKMKRTAWGLLAFSIVDTEQSSVKMSALLYLLLNTSVFLFFSATCLWCHIHSWDLAPFANVWQKLFFLIKWINSVSFS